MLIFPKRKIRYNSQKISLSDVILRLLFSVPMVLLSLPCTSYFHSYKTVLFANAYLV